MGDAFDGLGGWLLAAQDVLEAVLQEVDAAALLKLKAASVAWRAHVRRELCNRLWVRLSRREGQPEPAGVDSITDLDVECLNEAGRPWEVVVAGRQLPQLARLHGWGFVVDVQAVREAYNPEADDDDEVDDEDDFDDAPLGDDTLRSCIQGVEGQPPNELLLAAVACAASGTVRGVPVQRLRENDAIHKLNLRHSEICVTAATLLGFMLPAATSLRSLDLAYNQLCDLDEEGNGTYTTEGITKLCEGLKGSAVTSLNLGGNNLVNCGQDMSGLLKLVEILPLTKIESLGLTDNQLCGLDDIGHGTYTAEGITKLCEALKGSAVTSLDLANNKLCGVTRWGTGTYTAEGIIKLCEALKGSAVTSLNIGGNDIGAEGVSALAAILKETQITTLGLANNQLCGIDSRDRGTYTAEGITKLCEALKGSAVTSLDIGHNKIGAEGVSALAAILKETQITTLRLAGNHLCGVDGCGDGTYTAEGITKLCGALKGSPVTSLNLSLNGIGAEGASALAAILKETQITDLNLANNQLCGVSVHFSSVHISSELCGVSSRRIGTYTTEGITKLCEGLKGSAVTSLNLRSNDLNDEAEWALQDATGSGVLIHF